MGPLVRTSFVFVQFLNHQSLPLLRFSCGRLHARHDGRQVQRRCHLDRRRGLRRSLTRPHPLRAPDKVGLHGLRRLVFKQFRKKFLLCFTTYLNDLALNDVSQTDQKNFRERRTNIF